MFKRPFVTKSNTFTRDSYRKTLLSKIHPSYSTDVFAKKQFSLAVINTATGETVNVYTCEKQPLFFEVVSEKILYPTIYLGWDFPKSFPTFFIPETALVFIRNGADLMLPGVLHTEKNPIPHVEKGTPVFIAVRNSENDTVIGPYAVGKALMSTTDMFLNNMRGKGVQILHLYQDELWAFGHRESVPSMSLNDVVHFVDEFPESERITRSLSEIDLQAECGNSAEFYALEAAFFGNKAKTLTIPPKSVAPEPVVMPESEDEFLRRVFLYAIKNKITADQKYPIDAGQFYATFILKSLPEGRRLDIKKTSYKKFSTFLIEVNHTAGENNWFVKVVNKKGVDSITELNTKHPEVKKAVSLTLTPTDKHPNLVLAPNGRVNIADFLSLTEKGLNTLRLISPTFSLVKSDLTTQAEVSKLVLAYVTEKDLGKPGGKTQLDDTLSGIMTNFSNESVNINDVVQKICSTMTKTFVISTPDGRCLVKKTQLRSVEFKIEKRAGNKQVTLVNNLSVFGIDAKEIASKVSSGIATGATVNAEAPACIGPQLHVNGNKVNYVVELLTETYGLDKKYIKGIELGVKTKQKGGKK